MRLFGSPYRVYLLIRAHLLTNVCTYLLFALFGFLAQLLLILFLRWVLREEAVPNLVQYILFYFVTYIVVTVMAAWFAKPLRANPDQLMALTLPCKPVERMVAVVLWVGIVQVMVLTALFYAAFFVSDLFPLPIYTKPLPLAHLFSRSYLPGSHLLIATVMNVIVFYSGGVYFKKSAFIKTWLTLLAISYGAGLIAAGLLELFDPQFSVKLIWEWMHSGKLSSDHLFFNMLGMVWIQYATALSYVAVLWVLLREKQV